VAALPIYLRIQRGGTKLIFQRSGDGVSFQDVASKDIGATSTTINLRNEALAGLAVAAGTAGSSRYTFGAVSGPSFNTAAPEPPAGLLARGGVNQVTLSWSSPVSGPDPTGYAIYRAGSPGGPYPSTPVAQVPGEETATIDRGLSGGANYCYVVRARQGAQESRSSNESCAVTSGGGLTFRRSDVDGSGLVDISDAVQVLSYLFLGAGAPDCMEAADADNSGQVDITDAITTLSYLFLGAEPPAEPGPKSCGPDPAAPTLQCKTSCQ
jgi:hypothetical protein